MDILEIYHTILPIPTRSAHNRATLYPYQAMYTSALLTSIYIFCIFCIFNLFYIYITLYILFYVYSQPH